MTNSAVLAIVLLLYYDIASCQPLYDHEVDLDTKFPLIVAHRGSSGALPEHTVEAYTKAVKDGADVIECDLCVTKDLQLVCRHESSLSRTTDAEEVLPEERMNTYFITLSNVTDYFTVDFTLEELKMLTCSQRYSYRNPQHDYLYQIASLEEFIAVAEGADRRVGLHIETKDPGWVNSLDIITEANTTFEDLLLDVLNSHGYTESTDPVFLQSFLQPSVEYLSERTDLPIVFNLVGPNNDNRLEELSEFCYGIGVWRDSIVRTINDNIVEVTDLVERAHSFGLKVHVFTFRNEYDHLPWDYEQDPYEEFQLYLEQGIDAYFTDFSLSLRHFFNATYGVNC